MNLIDTHAHLTFDDLYGDVSGVIDRSLHAGVTGWITIGTEPADFDKVIALLDKHNNLYGGLGIHPHHAKDVTEKDIERLNSLCRHEKVLAVGETGLDFHYNFSKQDAQRALFRKQLDIASELQKPVIIHSRNAFDDTLNILDEYTGKLKRCVIHCYSGTPEQTQQILDRGYYISFTGIVTFKKSQETRIAAQMVPLNRLMIETDCPFISPEPVRNQRPCEPAMLVHTAKKIADIKEMDLNEFAEAVTQTSRQFFEID